LEGSFGIKAELIRGRGGIFVVKREGVVVFDKETDDRFPLPGELTQLLTV
jgi:predicted Rdx family selenoprotein